MRHQRTLDVADYLLGRELRGRQNMYLLHRATLTLDDFCGDNSRKREDQLLSTLNGEDASGNVVQIQLCLLDYDATRTNRWPIS
jgi:hypothetical protein